MYWQEQWNNISRNFT